MSVLSRPVLRFLNIFVFSWWLLSYFSVKVAPSEELVVIFVSTKLPHHTSISWLIDLSLYSLLQVFRTHPHLELHLKIYAQCGPNSTIEPEVLSESTQIHSTFSEYIDSIRYTETKVKKYFTSTEVYCGGILSEALCHSIRTIPPKLSGVNRYYFLLEHDWILLPNQIRMKRGPLSDVFPSGYEYVLFQRGDRARGNLLSQSPRVYVGKEYANNPYLATEEFMEYISGSDRCLSKNTRSPTWELDLGSQIQSSAIPIALLDSKRGNTVLYHWDGRYAAWAQQQHVGVIFYDLRALSTSFRLHRPAAYSKLSGKLLKAISSRCRTFERSCRPYAMREEFMSLLMKFNRLDPERFASPAHAISEFVSGDREFESMPMTGYLPMRKQLREFLE